jgi:Flp pilus assembly protein TadG
MRQRKPFRRCNRFGGAQDGPRGSTAGAARRAANRLARRRGGIALLYLMVAMVALVAFSSLAVDLGRVYVARSELQLAADAAARHGVAGLSVSVSQAQDNAITAANDNTADGTSVALDRYSDIEFGTWDGAGRTFNVLTGAARADANAVRVIARRTTDRGNAVSLLWGRIIGLESCNVQAASVAWVENRAPSGIVGFGSVSLKNNNIVAAYNSATNRNPSAGTANAFGNLSSNGAIHGGNNNDLKGGVILGPGAPNVTGIDISGATVRLTAPLVPPAEAAWTPAPNPNGLPQNYTAAGNVTLPGGTYWFTSLTVDGTLTFSAPATLTVNGPVTVGGALQAYDLVPANLKIYQRGANVFGDDTVNGMDVVADISAPLATFEAKNSLLFRGRMVINAIEVKNNAEIYYDVALSDATPGGPVIVTVK